MHLKPTWVLCFKKKLFTILFQDYDLRLFYLFWGLVIQEIPATPLPIQQNFQNRWRRKRVKGSLPFLKTLVWPLHITLCIANIPLLIGCPPFPSPPPSPSQSHTRALVFSKIVTIGVLTAYLFGPVMHSGALSSNSSCDWRASRSSFLINL